MAKILVVDDEADLEILIKQKFRRQIRENQYEFVFAVDGNDALDKLQQHKDVDLVLSDINMPGMDGLTLLVKLKEISPLLKTVIISAYGDMDNIRIAMNRGAFDFLTKPVNFEDLELTVEKTILHVKQLAETLKAIKENNILRMYVDETVLNFMNSREFESTLLANESIEATVVFIDICSFTSITENEPADRVVNLLNRYFDIMVKEIISQGGYIDKFIGDAIMAVFRCDFHLDKAVEACLGVIKQIELMPDIAEELHFHPKVSIGINSGIVISGNIGSSSLRRLDYTVIGDVVNTSQRLQSAAQAGQILIDENTFEKIRESFTCRRVEEINLKNKQNVITVYEILN
ncbi:MAG: adenylate/guanylate cyclase domain-containing protein [Bacteroidales bacterium]